MNVYAEFTKINAEIKFACNMYQYTDNHIYKYIHIFIYISTFAKIPLHNGAEYLAFLYHMNVYTNIETMFGKLFDQHRYLNQ